VARGSLSSHLQPPAHQWRLNGYLVTLSFCSVVIQNWCVYEAHTGEAGSAQGVDYRYGRTTSS
jgi:hypothetical protein